MTALYSVGPMGRLDARPVGRFDFSRGALAADRAAIAHDSLSHCRLCAHECGVNRLLASSGICRAGAEARIFSAQMEVSDELELSPVFAIAFSGCDLRCDFCITGAESWNAKAGQLLPLSLVAQRACSALEKGARTIMILGGEPTIHLAAALELVSLLPDSARLVWKTNAHGSAEARALLDGIFDVWVADYKFGNDACAARLAHVPNYTRTVRENLAWAYAYTDLIVRHLAMPGHIDCCWRPVAEWLATELPGVKVNLRTGFWPAWRSSKHRELRGTCSAEETAAGEAIARHYNLRLIV